MSDYTPAETAARKLVASAHQMGAATLIDGAVSSETLSSLRQLLPSPSLQALHEIADLGSCGGKGGFQRAIDIATTAIAIETEGRDRAAGLGAEHESAGRKASPNLSSEQSQ